MKSVFLLVPMIIGTIALALMAVAPKEWAEGKRGLTIFATIGATLSLMAFTAVMGKSLDETVGCMLLSFTDHCKQQAAEDLVKRATPLTPTVLRNSAYVRPGEKQLSKQQLDEIQAENCRKAQQPKPPRSPVVDVNGIYPGMPLVDAMEVLRCVFPGEDIITEGRFAKFGDKTVKLGEAVVRYGAMTEDGARTRSGRYEITYDDLGTERVVLRVRHAYDYGDDELSVAENMANALKAKYGSLTTFDGIYVFSPRGELQQEIPIDPSIPSGGLSPEGAKKIRESTDWSTKLRSCHDILQTSGPDLEENCGAVVSFVLRSNGLNVESSDASVARRVLPINARRLGQITPAPKAVF